MSGPVGTIVAMAIGVSLIPGVPHRSLCETTDSDHLTGSSIGNADILGRGW